MSWWKVAEKPVLQTPCDGIRWHQDKKVSDVLEEVTHSSISGVFGIIPRSNSEFREGTITQSLAVSLEGLCVKSVGSNSRGLWETDSPSCSANTVVIAATRPCSSLWYRCRIVVVWHIKTPLLHNSSYTTAVPRMAQQRELFKSTEDARRSKLLLFILHKLQRILVK